jgi:hypothetical protein
MLRGSDLLEDYLERSKTKQFDWDLVLDAYFDRNKLYTEIERMEEKIMEKGDDQGKRKRKIEKHEEKIRALDEVIERASNEWTIENAMLLSEEKQKLEEVELCKDMRIVISKKEYEEIYNYNFSCIEKESEEESLMKLRVFWAAYLNGDLKDEKRIREVNESHFTAMEILKSIEEKIEEEWKCELLEAEAIVDDALYHDLRAYECLLMLCDLNEQDKLMWIGIYKDGKRYARFSKWRYGEIDWDRSRKFLLNGGNIMAMQFDFLMMASMINPLTDFELAAEAIDVMNEFYETFEEIKLVANEVISIYSFEPEIQKVSEMLVDIPTWLCKLNEEMIFAGMVVKQYTLKNEVVDDGLDEVRDILRFLLVEQMIMREEEKVNWGQTKFETTLEPDPGIEKLLRTWGDEEHVKKDNDGVRNMILVIL